MLGGSRQKKHHCKIYNVTIGQKKSNKTFDQYENRHILIKYFSFKKNLLITYFVFNEK